MEQVIAGRAYVLGNNIDTDQIIPAEHLVYSLSDPEEKKKLRKSLPYQVYLKMELDCPKETNCSWRKEI